MPTYGINPYVSVVGSRLIPGVVQHAAFHRLTGEIIEPNADGFPQQYLIQREFLIPAGYDPLVPLLDHYVPRPIQNPAIAYRSKTGEWILVRTSMVHTVYSRRRDELPEIVEEKLSPLAAGILLMADGTKTLRQIQKELEAEDSDFRSAIEFLTT